MFTICVALGAISLGADQAARKHLSMSDAEGRAALALAEKIYPFLAGQSPEIQGSALADLVSMWCAGWQDEDLRERQFENWIECVRTLIPVSAAQIAARKTS